MSKKSLDVVTYVDGVKVTHFAYRQPTQKTWPISKSRYTVWAQTARKYTLGSGACVGTIDRIGS